MSDIQTTGLESAGFTWTKHERDQPCPPNVSCPICFGLVSQEVINNVRTDPSEVNRTALFKAVAVGHQTIGRVGIRPEQLHDLLKEDPDFLTSLLSCVAHLDEPQPDGSTKTLHFNNRGDQVPDCGKVIPKEA